MQCIVGKLFGVEKTWQIIFRAPFLVYPNLTYNFTYDVSFPAINFNPEEVAALRDYLTLVLDEYNRIQDGLEELNG
jgi:hypothetical protein